ncbi:SulP family inorganic anion transporter [Arsenicibacter rosenii]|uniref:SulP family inorganic anion transporter n=1 Tax=Arsenicibacter rosenii TaxID=1750698 RepID=UPI0009F62EDD|nr:SulP family inorganic anion transporter [Arsenicibacter rosenii]
MNRLQQNQGLTQQYLQGDIRGGVISFLVAVPLCLGIALASGAPLFSGILAGIVGGLVVGAFSRSSLSISGPEAGLIVVVLGALETLGSFPAVLLATSLAGVMQIGFGFARVGIISNFFPSTVIKGMLAGIGIILIMKQIPHLVGYDADAAEEYILLPNQGIDIVDQFILAFGQFNLAAILIAAVSLSLFWLFDKPAIKEHRLLKSVPTALVVVIMGILINEILKTFFPDMALRGNHLVQLPVPGSSEEYLKLLTFPDFSQLTNPMVYTAALSIAMVASLEALLAIEATDNLDPLKRKTPTDHELKAQGIGNIISGLVGGLPLTSVIVRSTVSLNAGARTKIAALVHGSLLLVCVLAIPTTLNLIPWASLASILLITGYRLASLTIFRQLFEQGLSKFLPFATTVAAILLTDLLTGIAIGMAVGIFFILRDNYRKGHQIDTTQTDGKPHIRIRLGEHVSFLNKAGIADMLRNVPDNAIVEIDSSRSTYIDNDVLELIRNFKATAQARNIHLIFFKAPANRSALPSAFPFSSVSHELTQRVF